MLAQPLLPESRRSREIGNGLQRERQGHCLQDGQSGDADNEARARARQTLVLGEGFVDTPVPAEVTRPFPIAELTLFMSELTSSGPIYTVISQVPFRGQD